MAENTGKKFRLSFVNAAEDIPRLVQAYGRACQGEFAMVLRPGDARGVLVLLNKEGGRFWRSSDADARTDAPSTPEAPVSEKDAVTLLKTEQKGIPKDGPITLKGQWSGWMHCDGGVPRVELVRKLASYGVLTITSAPGGWTWAVTRTEKWFSKPGSDTGRASTLVKAIEAGLARAMGLLGEACSVRDSRRRGALDAGWAVDHPVVPAKEGKDPLAKLELDRPRSTRKRAPAVTAPPAPEAKPARAPRVRAARAPAPATPSEADAAKDKALLDAFSAAVASAIASA